MFAKGFSNKCPATHVSQMKCLDKKLKRGPFMNLFIKFGCFVCSRKKNCQLHEQNKNHS